MKILLVSEDIPATSMGGLAKHVLLLARALVQAGHQVDLMGNAEHPFDPTNPELALPGRFFAILRGAQTGWKERALGCYNPAKRWMIARRFAHAILSRAGDYDVVHYHGHIPDLAAFIPTSVNFIQTRHDQGSDCLTHTRFRAGEVCREIDPTACARCATASPNYLQCAVSAQAVKQFRNRVKRAFTCHKTIFVSDMLRVNLCRTLGGSPADWGQVVHNFLDHAEVMRASGHPAERLVGRSVFVAGKLYAPKGIDALLAQLAPRLPADMWVTIAGNGPQEVALKSQHTHEHIHFLGWCDLPKVLSYAASSDFIVVPSICEESCATTVLEALALGKPVYALARGGTPELVRYECFPNQLRLFNSMDALADALMMAKPVARVSNPAHFKGDVSLRIPEILALYASTR